MDDNAAGAPEPLPLEEIPEVTLPEPVLPPRSRAVARGVKRTALGPVKGAGGDALRCAAGNTRDIVCSRRWGEVHLLAPGTIGAQGSRVGSRHEPSPSRKMRNEILRKDIPEMPWDLSYMPES